ncbi:DUF72 domain-containing protein [Microseira sp. BLCC-F43]|uniref:DUF72 domain-containing protein n=1 Tax=Microseira sp. BLCC-F43 TaxID=3153602 RepID=UPI0035BA33BC
MDEAPALPCYLGGQWGIGYSDEELSAWATRIREFLQRGVDVYVYFNNDLEGHAIRDGKHLSAMLDSCL